MAHPSFQIIDVTVVSQGGGGGVVNVNWRIWLSTGNSTLINRQYTLVGANRALLKTNLLTQIRAEVIAAETSEQAAITAAATPPAPLFDTVRLDTTTNAAILPADTPKDTGVVPLGTV